MPWIAASKCQAHSSGGRTSFPNAGLIVSIGYRKDQKSELRIVVGQSAIDKGLFRVKDPVDIAIDPDRNMIQLSVWTGETRAPAHLGLNGKRLGCGISLRMEWGIEVDKTIPSMPCSHVDIGRGVVTAKLPDSWMRFYRKEKA